MEYRKNFGFSVPEQKKIRLIINTDAKNEADDQYAIVHGLLTPKFDIKGFIAAHFGEDKSKTSMLDSYKEIEKIFDLMNIKNDNLIFHGAKHKITDKNNLPESKGSELIIQEAMKNDSRELFCIFLGPLTDMAIAIQNQPELVNKNMTVVWIGGGDWPNGCWEYNLLNDINAANIVFQSGVKLWQIPRNVYCKLRVSLSELQVKVKPYGEIGKYLFEQLVELNHFYADFPNWPVGESWCMGDSAAIGVIMDDQEFSFTEKYAPTFDENMNYIHTEKKNKIRLYEQIDSRFILEDFFCKLVIFNS